MPRSGIAELHEALFSIFLRNLHTLLCSGSVSLHPRQQCRKGLLSAHPLQHFLFLDFLMMVILTLVRWYVIVLICISLIISNDEHIFICVLATCVSLEKYLFRSSALFSIGLFVFLSLSCMSCVFWKLISCWLYYLQIFFLVPRLSFCLFMVSIALKNLLN